MAIDKQSLAASAVTVLNRYPRASIAAGVALLLLIGWFAYAPALTAGYSLDDRVNLGGLATVQDRYSALQFVFGGDAGPLGRPLALASFLPQADDFADGAGALLRVNILIHLLNGLLVAAFLTLLLKAMRPAVPTAIVTLSATAVWLYMPLLASASLMVVQRMTTLSATFVLSGLCGYLLARSRAAKSPVAALTGMTLALGAGGLLAALSKENGALLPVYLLAIESTLLLRPDSIRPATWRCWKIACLALPAVAILAYLASRLPYSEVEVLRRGFSGWERLLSEAGILWQYLLDAVMPLPGAITPANDAHPVASASDPLAILALLSWLALLVGACCWRRRYPLAAFAVLWFVGGHLLESTTLGLELYFNHRNYLPVLGPVFAACLALAQSPRRLLPAMLPAWALLQCAMLYSLTTLWGQPLEAARYWYANEPHSVRAATTLTSRQFDTEGVGAGLQTLHGFVNGHPQHAYLLIQDLNIACRLAPQSDHAQQVAALAPLLREVEFTYSTTTMLSQLQAAANDCAGVGPPALRRLATALRDNPRYRHEAMFNSQYHKLMALSYRQEGNIEQTLAQLQQARALDVERDVVDLQVVTLAEAGRFGDAHDTLATASQRDDWHPVRQTLRQRQLDDLGQYVDALQQAASGEEAAQ